jgi:hypothetical protein
MTDVDRLRERLGLPAAPLVLTGIQTTVLFFRSVLAEDPLTWAGYLQGIDFHNPVTRETLPKGTKLIRYESRGDRSLKPFSYFTNPGASPTTLGTTFGSSEYRAYETDRPTPALKSRASSISFNRLDKTSLLPGAQPFDRVNRAGGGIQYIVAFRDLPSLTRTGGRA